MLRSGGLNIHIIGIGGIGMSALALLLKKMKHNVQGSDIAESMNTKRLEENDIKVFIGHNEKNIENVDMVVYSSIINLNNPEIIYAKKNNQNIVSRTKILSSLLRFKKSIVVTGTHGKTTTTAIIASIFSNAELDPTAVVGGIMLQNNNNIIYGNGDWFIAEGDESDNTFINVPTSIGVVTNIDDDHLNFFGDFVKLRKSFYQFLDNVDCSGFAVVCFDNIELKNLVLSNRQSCGYFSYGIDCEDDVDVRAINIVQENSSTKFDVVFSNRLSNIIGSPVLEQCVLNVIGRFNILNALAAIVVASKVGIDKQKILDGLYNFSGVHRRLSFLGDVFGVRFFSDYAHHPTAIIATIEAIKSSGDSNKKIIAIVQPHRYSRMSMFFERFGDMVDLNTDVLIFVDVYSAGEETVNGLSSKDLVGYARSKKYNSIYYSNNNEIVYFLKKHTKSGDIVVFMGAGDIDKIAVKAVKDYSCSN